MCSSATAAVQSSTARLLLLQVAAQEGVRSDRISNGNAILYHLVYCCCTPTIYTSLPVFYELAPSSKHFRLARARHFGPFGFHLVVITLHSRWRQQQPTWRLQIPFSGILYLGHVLETRQIISRPGICHDSCRSVHAIEKSVSSLPDTYLKRPNLY
jgi:hypothetical protein